MTPRELLEGPVFVEHVSFEQLSLRRTREVTWPTSSIYKLEDLHWAVGTNQCEHLNLSEDSWRSQKKPLCLLLRPLSVNQGVIPRLNKVPDPPGIDVALLSPALPPEAREFFSACVALAVLSGNHNVVADLTLEERTCRNLLFNSCMLGDLGLARWRPPLLFSPFPPPRALTTS